MKPQTSIEVDTAAILKTYRLAIRARHSLAADREIARVLPEVKRRIDTALQEGREIDLNPSEVFDENFGS